MPDGLAFISAVIGFGVVIVAGAKLGAGSHASLAGLFAAQGARDWPTGVQETDAPRFVFRGPSATVAEARGARPAAIRSGEADGRIDTREIELVELYTGPIRSPR